MGGRIQCEDAVYESRELTPSECEALLRAGEAGRVALCTAEGPHVVPVNYSVVDGSLLLRTSPDSLLGRCGDGATLAFEVDHLDDGRRRGWSVVARGPAEVVRDPEEVRRIERVSPPRPWAFGDRPVHLRLRWTELSGRQLGTGWDAMLTTPRHSHHPPPDPGVGDRTQH